LWKHHVNLLLQSFRSDDEDEDEDPVKITDEDPGLRIESFAVINLRGVSTNKTIKYSCLGVNIWTKVVLG
jgi:hypothetical protein